MITISFKTGDLTAVSSYVTLSIGCIEYIKVQETHTITASYSEEIKVFSVNDDSAFFSEKLKKIKGK